MFHLHLTLQLFPYVPEFLCFIVFAAAAVPFFFVFANKTKTKQKQNKQQNT